MASKANDDQVAQAITQALSSDSLPSATAAPSSGVAADPKDLFCKNWDTVKMVLGFLRTVAPAFLKPIIDMVIKAGDAAKAVICH
jgi:hypothetical protein